MVMRFDYKLIEEKYLKGLNKGCIAVWEWDIQKNKFYYSKNLETILQRKLGNLQSLIELIDKVALEDSKSINSELEELLAGKMDTYKREFKINNRDGDEIWILIEGEVIRNYKNSTSLISGYLKDITERKRLRENIEYLFYYDTLTKLPNRSLFEKNFDVLLEGWKTSDKKGALIYIDIDDFKSVNDAYGPDYGDVLLKEVSKALVNNLSNKGIVHRLSADEFIVLIDGFQNINELNKICANICERCKESFKVKDKNIYITLSFGIATFPDDAINAVELYRYSDLALSQSKSMGKNSITFFDKSMSNRYNRKFLIEQELKNAIKNNELYIMYQPQFDSLNNEVIGFEALLRWENMNLGVVSPNEFIPIAESSGSILEIGEWVIDNVCKEINSLKDLNISFNNISINVSPMQLNTEFIDKLIDICNKNNTSPSLIEIEITEGMLIDLHNHNIEILNELIKRGIKIAVDDFGKGYSSLTYLTALPITTLKIDKSFVDSIHINKYKSVVKCIIDLCKSLDYRIVAEGVEEKRQLEILNNLGCSTIQGYYYSKPLYRHEIEKVINRLSS